MGPGRRLIGLVVLLGGFSPSCGSSTTVVPDAGPLCTEIGCGPTLRVRFSRPGWPAGAYRVEVAADGVRGACDLTIPLSCTAVSSCSGLMDFSADVSGCALDPALHSIAGVTIGYSTPASFTVRVLQGDRELGAASFSPSYAVSRPNGPDCEPVCRSAPTETLTLVR
jgi:hypothetical protein